MLQYDTNGWYDHREFVRAATALQTVAAQDPCRWLKFTGTKYLQIRVDMRTGDFIILDKNGSIIPSDVLYQMFPELEADGEIPY